MSAAKIEPTCEPFAFIGHCYTIEKNYGQAVRCYQKALSLDPSNEEAGSVLFAYLVTQHRFAEAQKLCEIAVENNVMSGWAYLRLGRLFKDNLNYAKAINNFQQVLRIDSTNALVWAELGECYLNYGKHVPAMKALTRSDELCSNPTTSTLLAKVKLILGNSEEALELIAKVCEEYPSFIYAQSIMAEILYSIAKFDLEISSFGSCERTIERAIRIIKSLPLISSVLKLLGDFYMLYNDLPFISSQKEFNVDTISRALNKKLEKLSKATSSYSKVF